MNHKSCNAVKLWSHDRVNLWSCNSVNLWSHDLVNLWPYDPVNLWSYMISKTCHPMIQLSCDPMIPKTCDPMIQKKPRSTLYNHVSCGHLFTDILRHGHTGTIYKWHKNKMASCFHLCLAFLFPFNAMRFSSEIRRYTFNTIYWKNHP